MKRLLFGLAACLLFSCGGDEYEPVPTIETPYALVLENCSDGEIMALGGENTETALFSWRFLKEPGETSDTIRLSKDAVLITWSGEGTHWNQRTKFIELEKNKVLKVQLTTYLQ